MPAEVRAYLRHLKRRNYSAVTIDGQTKALERFILFLRRRRVRRTQDVTEGIIESYLAELEHEGLKRSSIGKYLIDVQKLYGYMEKQGLLFENPAEDIRLLDKPRLLPDAITVEEVHALLNQPDTSDAIGFRDRAMLEMLYATGARRDEMVNMTIPDLNLGEELVRVTGKGSKQRFVPLGRHATQWTEQYLHVSRPKLLGKGKPPTDVLWMNAKHTPLQGEALGAVVRKYGRQTGVMRPITTHTLRRTCATHLLMNGAHPVAVAEMLGHADLRSLGHYLRVTIAELQEMHRRSKPGL